MSHPEPKFKVGDAIRVVRDPADAREMGDAAGLTGKVFEADWFPYGNCWSYGVLVEGCEYAAVESDLESA